MTNQNPLFSIITVSFNSARTIEKTILSVLNQTYKNIEYIIIDGGSTDGTVDIIKKYSNRISYWVSEKDNGIYDAMNTGTDIANGDYLNFMNSDDYFFSENVINNVIPFCNQKYDIIYGDTEVRYKDFKFIKKNSNPNHLWMSPVNHQSSFIKRETMQKYKYNTANRLVADFEFFLNVYYSEGGAIKKIDEVIASYYADGISGKEDKQVIIDCYKTITKFRKNIFITMFYKILRIKPIIKKGYRVNYSGLLRQKFLIKNFYKILIFYILMSLN